MNQPWRLFVGALALGAAACGKRPVSVTPDPAASASTVALVAIGAAPSTSTAIVSTEGAYRVTYPAGARIMDDRVVEVATDAGTIGLHITGANAGDAIYSVEWGNYPPYFVVEQGASTILENGIRAVVATQKGTVIAESAFVDHDDHWQRVVYRVDGEIPWHELRATMRGARMYIVMVAALERAGIEDVRAKAFFASFTITSAP
jgi:hypothetical protein